jgi:hypothetical protein
MNQTTEIETAPAMTLGEELQVSIRRAERLLSHYHSTGRKSEAAMLDRDISQARVNLTIGNEAWMRKSLAVMTTYED